MLEYILHFSFVYLSWWEPERERDILTLCYRPCPKIPNEFTDKLIQEKVGIFASSLHHEWPSSHAYIYIYIWFFFNWTDHTNSCGTSCTAIMLYVYDGFWFIWSFNGHIRKDLLGFRKSSTWQHRLWYVLGKFNLIFIHRWTKDYLVRG